MYNLSEVKVELEEIKELLFFVQASYDQLYKSKRSYDNREEYSSDFLANGISRSLNPLMTLNYTIGDKIDNLQEKIPEFVYKEDSE
ncbi:MAG: hypothetical protein ACK5NA_08455 [Enterococcus sp.]